MKIANGVFSRGRPTKNDRSPREINRCAGLSRAKWKMLSLVTHPLVGMQEFDTRGSTSVQTRTCKRLKASRLLPLFLSSSLFLAPSVRGERDAMRLTRATSCASIQGELQARVW